VPFGAPKPIFLAIHFATGAPIGAPKLLTRWYKQCRVRSQWIWVTQFFSQPSADMPPNYVPRCQPQHRTYVPGTKCGALAPFRNCVTQSFSRHAADLPVMGSRQEDFLQRPITAERMCARIPIRRPYDSLKGHLRYVLHTEVGAPKKNV
jgi:hypothetical protein